MADIAKCPNCGAPDKDPERPKTYRDAWNMPRNRPTIYTCGSVTSPEWGPPVIATHCADKRSA